MERPGLLTVLRLGPSVARILWRLRWRHPRADVPQLLRAATPRRAYLQRRPDRAHAAARIARALVRRVPRLFPQPCLYSSLAGYYFLRAAGCEVTWCCGVRRDGDGLACHAWLLLDGAPYLEDPEAGGFVEMLRLPAPSADGEGPSPADG